MRLDDTWRKRKGACSCRCTLLRSIDNLAYHRFYFDAGLALVSLSHRLHEALRVRLAHKIDCRTPEAPSREPCPEAARLGLGQIDKEIQLEATVLEKIARAGVALKKILAELLDIAIAQQTFAGSHA